MKKVSTAFSVILFASTLLINVSIGPNHRVRLISPASAKPQLYQPVVVQCVDDGQVVGAGMFCASGTMAQCLSVACDN